MRRCVRLQLILLAWLALPAAAYAQASITGVVRDASGAVLPGVTVEAASPALIEKVRSVVTDGTGQYRIENLRPGSYTVTFTLPGFATSKREGIELTGAFVASVNTEMRVGALEETITVSGESPVVDVQSTIRQQVLNEELIGALPSGRNAASMAGLLPAVTIANQDVGGLTGESGSAAGSVTVHGNSEVRTLVSGLSVASAQGSGSTGVGNIAAYQEMSVDISGDLGRAEGRRGPDEPDPERRRQHVRRFVLRGLCEPVDAGRQLHRGIEGPRPQPRRTRSSGMWISTRRSAVRSARDSIWFYATIRYNRATNFAPIFFNKNAGNPNAGPTSPIPAATPPSTTARSRAAMRG